MTESFAELCCTPVTDDPISAGLAFATGAAVAFGTVLLGHHVVKETLRRDEERERGR